MEVQIRVLGDARLNAADGGQVTLTSRRSWGLLAFLVLSGGRPLSRMEVAGLLWPDSGETQARASLRQELAVLRKALRQAGLDPVETGKETLRYTGAPGLADVSELDRRMAGGSQGDLREAAALYRGDLLAGMSFRSDPFTDWLDAERTRLRGLALGALEEQLRAAEEAGIAQEIAVAAQALLEVDPAREPAHQALMRALLETGRKAEALRQYETCRAALQRHLGAEPSQTTLDLVAEIRAAPDRAPARTKPETAQFGTEAAVLVMVLPEVAGLASGFDPGALFDAQSQFNDFARRTATELGGRCLAGPGDRVVSLFAEPEAAALAALMVAGEPVPIAGAAAFHPGAGLAWGRVAAVGTAGFASVALHAAARLAVQAGPGELLAQAALQEALETSFSLSQGPGPDTIRVTAPDEPEPVKSDAPNDSQAEVRVADMWRGWRQAMTGADLASARRYAARAEASAGGSAGVGLVMAGGLDFFRGRLGPAEAALAGAETIHTLPDGYGQDPGLCGRVLLAWLRALRGRPGAAGETLRRALSEAQGAGRPATLVLCQVVAAAMQEDLGETQGALAAAREAFGAAKGHPHWQALALGLVGRARDRLGNPTGAGQMSDALSAYRAAGGALMEPFFHAWMAEASLEAGRAGEALVLADEGLSHGSATGVALMEPELLRLQALALVRQGHGGEGQAEGAYVAAIEAARRAGAGLFELRASVGFAAHLWRAGRVQEAAARLESGLAAVETGGPPVADVRAARALQRRLAVA